MSFPLFTTIPPNSDFRPLVDNWESSGFKVTSVNSSEEANIFRTADVEVLEVESDQNRLKITEIMSAIADTGTPIAGFINADCRFIQPLDSERIKTFVKNSLVLAERIDVDKTGGATTVLSLGFDAFFFDTATLRSLPDTGYRIGMPWWDYWFPLVMQRSGLALKRFSCPILLHTAHHLNWDEDAFLKGGRALQAEFPSMRVIENDWPNPMPAFTQLSNSPTVLPPNISTATAELFSSIPALVKDIHTLQQSERQLRDEAARRNNETKILRQENAALSHEAAQRNNETEILRQENASLSHEAAQRSHEAESLRQETAVLKQEVSALRNSSSFRITYPLRLTVTLARHVIAKAFGRANSSPM
jgi:hypothetical protein